MKVILIEKIAKLGDLGNEVIVKPGFARNYLLPKQKAVRCTPDNLKMFAEKRAEYEQKAQERLAHAEKQMAAIQALAEITMETRVAEGGKLYGSIGLNEILIELQKAGIEIEKRSLNLPSGPIREIGEYAIEVHLPPDLIAPLTLKVLPLSA